MAGFCLHLTREIGAGASPQMSAAHMLMEQRGLERSRDLSRPGFQLRYYGKILAHDDQLAQDDHGNFALACGALIYDDAYGQPALAALLHDFEPSWSCLRRASGQFVLIVFKAGALHISTDLAGQCHIYRCGQSCFYSSSFLATCRAAPSCTPVPMTIRERLVCGAIHGDETVFAEVDRLPARQALQLLPETRTIIKPALPPIPRDLGRRDAALEQCATTLLEVLRPLVTIWDSHMVTPLTSGYDSRLLTAGLRALGGSPHHLVYGQSSDPDVVISQAICREQGWDIDHLDKSQLPDPPLDTFADLIRRSFLFHDGRGIYGVFDNGGDLESRWQRGQSGRLYLNGSAGGIFRDLVDVGGGRCSVDQFVRSRYERLDRSWFHDDVVWSEIMDHAATRISALFEPPTAVLENWQLHALIPRWFARYWMSPDNQNNNTLSPSLVPFTDPRLTELTLALPQNWRNEGIFEADLIRTISPALAAHQSGYGWRFDERPPWKVRWRRRFKHSMPGPLRQRWQRRARSRQQRQKMLPIWLGQDYQDAVLGSGPLLMNEFVNSEAIRDQNARNIVLTLELLLRETH